MTIARLVIAALLALLFAQSAWAGGPWLLTPLNGAERIHHPFFGDSPAIPPEAFFAPLDANGVKVYARITAYEQGNKDYTSLVLIIKNEEPYEKTISPKLDLMDGYGQVLRVASYQNLIAAARSAGSSSQSGSSSFFAYGSQRFVTGAMAGYAIGSVFNELVRSNQRENISHAAAFIERYWLRDQYRIPPHAQVVAWVALTGRPNLPLTARLTVDQNTFSFHSVQTDQDALANVEKEASANAAAPIESASRPAVADSVDQSLATPSANKQKGIVANSKYMFAAERLAKSNGCPTPVASLSYAAPGIETFTIDCQSGEEPLLVRCDGGACRILK